MKKLVLFLASAALLSSPAWAQQESGDVSKYIELLRSDVRTARTEVVTEALNLAEPQSTAFWPIYREYEKEMAALGDKRIALIKQYAANYDSMTDKMAKDLANQAFKLNGDRLNLMKKYYGKVEKVLQPKLAARWAQVENAMNALIDVQIASELPLMKK
jgi:hypothetical protein